MASSRVRRLMFGALFVAMIVPATIAVSAVGSSFSKISLAQAQSTEPISASQTPPPVPGLEHPDVVAGNVLSLAPDLIPATPVVPGLPADASGTAGVADSGGDYTTNLGGSDVAVASEGGSYEVDGPKRKGKRMPAPTPKP